jgi:hypothetical protein
MAGIREPGTVTTAGAPRRSVFNPVWLMDAAGICGLIAFVVPLVFAVPKDLALLATVVNETALLLIGCALVVRVLDAILKRRDRRNDARRELMRRLSQVNDALLDLRKSLSRDHARSFLDRRGAFAAGVELAQPWLSTEETKLVQACDGFCDRMTAALGETVHRRVGVASLAERVRRDIERAARQGDLDRHDADNLANLVDDAMGVLDEAIYPEWNADHFGRLGADGRAFAREIERYKGAAAERIEHHGGDLFEVLGAQVNRKIEIVDMLRDWDDGFQRLEMRVAGLKPPPVVVAEPRPEPRLADRFVALPGRIASVDSENLRARLPAAND